MTREFKGTSPFALLADRLPVRARIGLTLVASDLALRELKSSPNFPIARTAFERARRWFDGDRFNPDLLADAVSSERDKGTTLCELEAKSEPEISAWGVLGSALAYTAFHAYRATGDCPDPMVSEVDENVLDEIDKSMRIIAPDFIITMKKAAGILERIPELSFAQLMAEVSKV
jgi:hypothetical protein